MSVMEEGGEEAARLLNVGRVHVGGARGWGRWDSVAGCEGPLQRLKVKECLAANKRQ